MSAAPLLPSWAKDMPSPTGSAARYLGVFQATRKRLAAMGLCAIAITFIFMTHNGVVPNAFRSDLSADVFNRTLGFQKVFAISMESRTDKRDTRTLAAALTGFDIEWLPGVAFEDVSEKAAPPTWNYTLQSPGALGCWRAHMNAIQRVVADGLESALILEDDADWDVHLKAQLSEFARGARAVQAGSGDATQQPPSIYGDDWDLLWVGHCRVGPSYAPEQDFWIVDGDVTVAPPDRRHAWWRNERYPDFIRRNDTRVVLRANVAMCTAGYAVSQRGARKMLSSLSLESHQVPGPVDVGMSHLCRQRLARPFKCYAPHPPLFASHRAAGSEARDSDLNEATDLWHDAYTWDIVYSTALNSRALVEGSTVVDAQWPEVEYPTLPLNHTSLWQPGYLLKGVNLLDEATSMDGSMAGAP